MAAITTGTGTFWVDGMPFSSMSRQGMNVGAMDVWMGVPITGVWADTQTLTPGAASRVPSVYSAAAAMVLLANQVTHTPVVSNPNIVLTIAAAASALSAAHSDDATLFMLLAPNAVSRVAVANALASLSGSLIADSVVSDYEIFDPVVSMSLLANAVASNLEVSESIVLYVLIAADAVLRDPITYDAEALFILLPATVAHSPQTKNVVALQYGHMLPSEAFPLHVVHVARVYKTFPTDAPTSISTIDGSSAPTIVLVADSAPTISIQTAQPVITDII